MSKRNIKLLVIGGGTGGLSTIVKLRKLDKAVEIVLVEPKDFFEISASAYRSPFENWVAEDALLPLNSFCTKNNVQQIRDIVTKLDTKSATLSGGDVISFDVCLVATGANADWKPLGRGPPSSKENASREKRLQEMKDAGSKLIQADSVLVVGGGLIGCELAADLAFYSNKAGSSTQVTLVHSGKHLIPEYDEKPAAMVKRKLEKLGVKVILNDKAVEQDGKMVLQSSKQEINAQEVVKTVGFFAVNDFLKEGGFADSLNEKGFIETDSFLRVEGMNGKVFAIGDCCTHLPNAAFQVVTASLNLANNLKVTLDALAEHQLPNSEPKLKEITAVNPAPYLCTVGPKDGVVSVKGYFYTQFILPRLKNKTMFHFKVKADLGF
jgi:apoptosis-inducing factor 2